MAVSAYAPLFGGFLLLGGRVADIIGRRRVFVAGLVVFTAALLISGLAWSEASLIAARGLQGLGAALITRRRSRSSAPRSQRARNGTPRSAPGARSARSVPSPGCSSAESLPTPSWEWIFFVNVPVGIAGLALAFPP